MVRRGKGDKDRSTLLAEVGRDELRAHLRESEAARSPLDILKAREGGDLNTSREGKRRS